jgi:hypothetical protein
MSLAARRAMPNAAEMRDDLKKEMSQQQIEEGDRHVATMAPSRPKAGLVTADLEDQIEAKFPAL